MKTILNINLTDNQYENLVIKVMYNTRKAWEADEKGDHANGILSEIGKVSCQLLYDIYREDKTGNLCLSPETISAINFVNLCVPVDIEDCISFMHMCIPETVNVLGETLDKEDAETIFEKLIEEYENMVDMVAAGLLNMISSTLCLAISKFLDAGVGKGKVDSYTEILIRARAIYGDEFDARLIIRFSE